MEVGNSPIFTQEKDTDLQLLIEVIPDRIRNKLLAHANLEELLEVVLDLGRPPEARFLGINELIDIAEVDQSDLDFSVAKVGMA